MAQPSDSSQGNNTGKRYRYSQRVPVQHVTKKVLQWIASEVARGNTRNMIYRALIEVGWQSAAASEAMQLTPDEAAAFARTGPTVALAGIGTLLEAGDKWVEVVQRQLYPELVEFGNFLSVTECQALMEAARSRLSRSLTVDTQTGNEILHSDRTSQGMFFERSENAVVQLIEARIARLLNWPVENGEGMQVLRYPPGAEYKPHYDYFDPAEPGSTLILQRGGQRVATLIIYLHEPVQGGATVFPDIGLRVVPRRGHAVFFSYPQAHPDSLTLHGGEPVTTGEKWIATKWLWAHEFR